MYLFAWYDNQNSVDKSASKMYLLSKFRINYFKFSEIVFKFQEESLFKKN